MKCKNSSNVASTVYVQVTELKHFSLGLHKHVVSRPKKIWFWYETVFLVLEH